MGDPPDHSFFDVNSVNPTWQSSQRSNVPFASADLTVEDPWVDFMSWNPANPQSQSSSSVPASLTAATSSAPMGSMYARRDTETETFASGLNARPYPDPMATGFSGPAFAFGADTNASTAGFDFDLSGMTETPDVPGFLHSVDSTAQLIGSSQVRRVGSSSLSPIDLKSQEVLGNRLSGSPESPTHSPSSMSEAHITPSSSNGSPEPRTLDGRKRKSTDFSPDLEKPGKKNARQRPIKKTAHNMIEKRYRNKLNDKIEELKNSVPSLKRLSTAGLADDNDEEDLDGLTPAHKTNKATILSKATEYIRHLEKRNRQLHDEMQAMKVEMDKLKKFTLSATMQFNPGLTTPEAARYREDSFPTSAGPGTPNNQMPPQGMIPVPESMMNLHGSTAGQTPYAHSYPYSSLIRGQTPHQTVRMQGGAPFSKMMVGALAGLMILEGLSEREESGDETEARGLFAIPFRLLARSASGLSRYTGLQGTSTSLLPLFKVLLLVGAVVYLISPLLDLKPRTKKKSAPEIGLSRAPSVASPIEARRNAWLTAVQTVWVPHHNFFYELAALALKTIKLSARRLIGWHAYAVLTGATKEQETARVSAWKIALDAQLTGGDAEISISRLILTVLASGTLPDTPARLMLKSLHVRVLLWEIVKAGYGKGLIFDGMCAKLARHYWNAARHEHQLNGNCASRSRVQVSVDPDTEIEPLPKHLAALLLEECDDVLTDSIIQRAYNLAWNRPSESDDSMDGVTEDFGISSPLDALAAWYSCYVTKRALSNSLASTSVPASKDIQADVDLAIRIAPPASTAYIRALTAKAVLVHDDRPANIAAAMAALPLTASPAPILENAVTTPPITGDVKMALMMAKCLSLLVTNDETARGRVVDVVTSPSIAKTSWTLLSFAAAYKVMNAFAAQKVAAERDLHGLAAALRLWIGRECGRKLRLGKTRGRVVERCLVLIREDEEKESGYGSAEE